MKESEIETLFQENNIHYLYVSKEQTFYLKSVISEELQKQLKNSKVKIQLSFI